MTDCIFCKIATHTVPTKIEYESDLVIAFPSISPVSETHLLIVPKEHIESIINLEDKHKATFLEMIKAAQKLISDKNISGGYKLIFNGGKYQSVPHLHLHLIAGSELDKSDKPESRT